MNEINEQLKAINVHLSIIDSKTQLINARLDELIAALHEYDDESYGESSFEAFKDTQGGSCVGNEHNIDVEEEMRKYTEQEMEKEAERRMNIIGQNGNTGEHYDDDRELGGEG